MGKNKKRRQASLLPLLAVAAGLYLLMRPAKPKKTDIVIIEPLPTGSGPVVQRLLTRRVMPTYV